MKKVIAPLLCIPFLLLAACTDEAEKAVTHSESKEFKPETVKIGEDGELNIVPLYAPYQTYLKASLKADTSETDTKNYAEYVLRYIDKIGEKENFDPTTLETFFMLKATAYEQDLLNQTNELMKQHDEIKDIITKNYSASYDALPKKKATIFIAPSNPEFWSMTDPLAGVSGAAFQDSIIIQLNPNFDKEVLAYTIAHEYHHLVLNDTPELSRIDTSLDSVIFEGKADAFADQIVTDVSPPWNIPMDDTTKKHVARLIGNGEADYQEITMGNTEKDIPLWSRYSLGRDILTHHLKANPDLAIKTWTYEENHAILKGYKYQKLIE